MRRTVLAGGKQNKSHWPGLIGVSVLSLVFLLLTVGVGMYAGLTSAVDNRVLPEGTRIDRVNLGGVAADEALSIISANTDSNLDAFRIDVMGYSRDLTWTAEDVGLRCDYETLVEQAAYPEPKGSVLDTFEQYASMTAGGEYHSTVTIDETEVRRLVEVLASQVTVAPVSATAIFEPVSESFTYTADAPGQELDVEGMVAHILAGFDGENLAPIAVDMEQFLRRAEPPVTQAALMANTVLIGECMTAVTNNENRNTNIRLMCEAVDGICLLPGEQLSLNDLVGERTEEKGFRYAGAIVDGKIVDDVGGGICQLAGTLYNAVLLSDLEVVERVRHTYPSDYLPIGLDATLNWNNKDLVIANNTEYPIYFGTKLSENKENTEKTALIEEICEACANLSESRTGALIAIEGITKLGDEIKSGVVVNADVSRYLIGNIFFNKAPLHDGAMIIRDSRVYACGCFLPLSHNHEIIKELGTRHRAAIGLSEVSDAFVIVVSEETGMISVARDGKLTRNFDKHSLAEQLKLLYEVDAQKKENPVKKLYTLTKKKGGKNGER